MPVYPELIPTQSLLVDPRGNPLPHQNGYARSGLGDWGIIAPTQIDPEVGRSAVLPARIWRFKQSRYNPIRNLKPQTLATQMDEFDAGFPVNCARTWKAIIERDDTLKAVSSKRRASVRRMQWKVIVDPDIEKEQQEEAEEHVKALKYFYKNLIATSAVDRDWKGGFSLLVDQIMDALAFKYAIHELLWRPVPGEGLTCTFNYVPLDFFENATGQMRFLRNEGETYGVEMEKDAWMVTCGDCLMRASAVAYMYKNLSLKDWVIYNERHGMPAIIGSTNATKDTPQWIALEEAVGAVATGFSGVKSDKDTIDIVTLASQGQIPFPVLVDRMDRFMSILWRGGDLSTISSGNQSVGSNPQQEEGSSLEQVDAQLVSETLNMKIDPIVIAYHFGEGTKPLAFLKLCAPDRKDVSKEISVDQFLLNAGAELGLKERMEFYGRSMPEEGEEMLKKQIGIGMDFGNPDDPNADDKGRRGGTDWSGVNWQSKNAEIASQLGISVSAVSRQRRLMANERQGLNRGEADHVALLRNAIRKAADAEAQNLEPLWERLDGLMEILSGTDEKAKEMALKKFVQDLPEIQKQIARNPAGARAFEAIQTAGVFNGFTEAVVARN